MLIQIYVGGVLPFFLTVFLLVFAVIRRRWLLGLLILFCATVAVAIEIWVGVPQVLMAMVRLRISLEPDKYLSQCRPAEGFTIKGATLKVCFDEDWGPEQTVQVLHVDRNAGVLTDHLLDNFRNLRTYDGILQKLYSPFGRSRYDIYSLSQGYYMLVFCNLLPPGDKVDRNSFVGCF
jgi:hypothetical protein